jgi:hypothetical protein
MGRRPQKPEGLPSSPRHRKRNRTLASAMVSKSISNTLKELTRGTPTGAHLSEIQEQAKAENNDRGAAILMATNLENALEYAIEKKLQLSEEQREEMFSFDAPVGTFSRKIIIGSAVKLIGSQARMNLNIVRLIRNTFAHARIPITFQTAGIKSACDALVIPSLFPQIAVSPLLDHSSQETGARDKYRIVCERTAHNLQFISMPTITGNAVMSNPRHGNVPMPQTPQSLP